MFAAHTRVRRIRASCVGHGRSRKISVTTIVTKFIFLIALPVCSLHSHAPTLGRDIRRHHICSLQRLVNSHHHSRKQIVPSAAGLLTSIFP
jgi:hypothetical protein